MLPPQPSPSIIDRLIEAGEREVERLRRAYEAKRRERAMRLLAVVGVAYLLLRR
jgi:hypothetical protein